MHALSLFFGGNLRHLKFEVWIQNGAYNQQQEEGTLPNYLCSSRHFDGLRIYVHCTDAYKCVQVRAGACRCEPVRAGVNRQVRTGACEQVRTGKCVQNLEVDPAHRLPLRSLSDSDSKYGQKKEYQFLVTYPILDLIGVKPCDVQTCASDFAVTLSRGGRCHLGRHRNRIRRPFQCRRKQDSHPASAPLWRAAN
jgi:hypothetical protein